MLEQFLIMWCKTNPKVIIIAHWKKGTSESIFLSLTCWSFLCFWVGLDCESLSLPCFSFHRARVSKTDRGFSLFEGLLPLLSFFLMIFLFYTWAILSPANILEIQPRLFFTATGIVFSNVTVRCFTCSGWKLLHFISKSERCAACLAHWRINWEVNVGGIHTLHALLKPNVLLPCPVMLKVPHCIWSLDLFICYPCQPDKLLVEILIYT